MKYFVFIIAVFIIFSGCTSNAPETNSTNAGTTAPNANQTNANTAGATNANPPGGMVPYNGGQNFNPAAFNATNDNLKVIKYQPKPGEMPIGSRIAPDDSYLVSGSRGKDFFETRTFRSHPTIDKVEKIMDGKTTKYKVYLKGGKVVEAPADKMNNMEAIAPDNILEAIGMKTEIQKWAETHPNTDEKKEQKP